MIGNKKNQWKYIGEESWFLILITNASMSVKMSYWKLIFIKTRL